MTGIKIWFTAQALTFIAFVFLMQEASILAAAFTAVAGIPALIAFEVWFRLLAMRQISRRIITISSLIVIPAITAANAILFDNMMENVSREFPGVVAAAVLSSFIAAAMFTPGFSQRRHSYYQQRRDFVDQIAQ